jgi:alpha-N-acetylglucosaminidase
MNATQFMHLPATPLVDVSETLGSVNSGKNCNENDVPNSAYEYDLIDVGRQVVVNLYYDVFRLFQIAYARKDFRSVSALGSTMLEMVLQWDRLLAAHKGYLMGIWIAAARSWGVNTEQADLYEFNARNQITLWGPNGQIEDYAAKNWAGLAGQFYHKRCNSCAIKNPRVWDLILLVC